MNAAEINALKSRVGDLEHQLREAKDRLLKAEIDAVCWRKRHKRFISALFALCAIIPEIWLATGNAQASVLVLPIQRVHGNTIAPIVRVPEPRESGMPCDVSFVGISDFARDYDHCGRPGIKPLGCIFENATISAHEPYISGSDYRINNLVQDGFSAPCVEADFKEMVLNVGRRVASIDHRDSEKGHIIGESFWGADEANFYSGSVRRIKLAILPFPNPPQALVFGFILSTGLSRGGTKSNFCDSEPKEPRCDYQYCGRIIISKSNMPAVGILL